MRGEIAEYRRGFAYHMELGDMAVGIARLKRLKSHLLAARTSMKEKNVVRIREDLGL